MTSEGYLGGVGGLRWGVGGAFGWGFFLRIFKQKKKTKISEGVLKRLVSGF